jgi:hypothetical protein
MLRLAQHDKALEANAIAIRQNAKKKAAWPFEKIGK